MRYLGFFYHSPLWASIGACKLAQNGYDGHMQLSDWLARNRISVADFQRKIGVRSYSTVRRYLLGERVPRPAIMRRIVAETKGKVTANDFHQGRAA